MAERELSDRDPSARIVALVRRTEGPEPTLTPAEAVLGLSASDVAYFLHGHFEADPAREVIATGIAASPGAASGELVLSADGAVAAAAAGRPVILARRETTPDDVVGMQCARGIVTARGGMASHAALVARGWGIPAVVGAAAIEITEGSIRVGERTIAAGSWLSLDGSTGEVFLGAGTVVNNDPPPELETLLAWADKLAAGSVVIRANADTTADARVARALGARGIGLCRTEHMFLEPQRLPLVRRFILADNATEERNALAALEDAQRHDFEAILTEMDGLPVTIRLLDAPLHEFLPDIDVLAAASERGELDEFERRQLAAARDLREMNPMMGTRGVRLAVTRPGLYPMQLSAICRAAVSRLAQGGDPRVEILIPMVMDPAEMVLARSWIAAAVAASGPLLREIRVGAMIETPRAALLAAEIAAVADFISFGTNDLTQLVAGLSRDDAEARLLPHYLAHGLLAANPFESFDGRGVGRLVRLACDEARSRRPEISIGVCGEHAGDPESITALVACGIDSLSCSPYRVPIARVAVAQALLRSGPGPERSGRAGSPASVADPLPPSLPELGIDARGDASDDASIRHLVLHALRIKGFSTLEVVAELTGVDPSDAAQQLDRLRDEELVRFIEARSLWQLTPRGRDHHQGLLPGIDEGALARLRNPYGPFLDINRRFKQLCAEWQVRDGVPNDHLDEVYDADVIDRLVALHEDAHHVIDAFTGAVARFGLYSPRLARACERTAAGDVKMFTGAMCGSYHDVWMELHEDLMLVLGIDRTQEESF